MPEAAAECAMIRSYLDWLIELSWAKLSPERIDIAEARRILDENHYGLEKVKRRILEYFGVRKLNPMARASASKSIWSKSRISMSTCPLAPPQGWTERGCRDVRRSGLSADRSRRPQRHRDDRKDLSARPGFRLSGIKEKVLAAARAGIVSLLLPARNREDLEDVPRTRTQAHSLCLARTSR